MFDSNLL